MSKEKPKLKAIEYELLNGKYPFVVTIKFTDYFGTEGWMIAQRESYLSKVMDEGYYPFILHRMSALSEDDYNNFRFDSPEDAYEFWVQNRSKILATQQDWIDYERQLDSDGEGD